MTESERDAILGGEMWERFNDEVGFAQSDARNLLGKYGTQWMLEQIDLYHEEIEQKVRKFKIGVFNEL